MILGGIQQVLNLVVARRLGSFSFLFWITPSLIMLTGLFVILKPMETAQLSLMILGWCSLLYGVTEVINSVLIWRIRKVATQLAAQQQKATDETVAEEISSELDSERAETEIVAEAE